MLNAQLVDLGLDVSNLDHPVVDLYWLWPWLPRGWTIYACPECLMSCHLTFSNDTKRAVLKDYES